MNATVTHTSERTESEQPTRSIADAATFSRYDVAPEREALGHEEVRSRFDGDFAAGLRRADSGLEVRGDFATGMRSLPVVMTTGDFASGVRTRPTAVLVAGDFATGQRTGR
jgi:hypothetical protein